MAVSFDTEAELAGLAGTVFLASVTDGLAFAAALAVVPAVAVDDLREL